MTENPLVAALERALAVKLRGIAVQVTRNLTRRGLTQAGTLRLGEASAHDGVLAPPSGGTGHEGGAEPPLGNPTTTGQALTSTADGARSWLDVATQAELDAVAGVLAAHEADTTAAHAASAIAFTPNGTIAATTVQAAIQEVRDEAGSGAGHAVYDEGVALTARPGLNFAGAGVTVTDDATGGKTLVTIPGGGGGGAPPTYTNLATLARGAVATASSSFSSPPLRGRST